MKKILLTVILTFIISTASPVDTTDFPVDTTEVISKKEPKALYIFTVVVCSISLIITGITLGQTISE